MLAVELSLRLNVLQDKVLRTVSGPNREERATCTLVSVIARSIHQTL